MCVKWQVGAQNQEDREQISLPQALTLAAGAPTLARSAQRERLPRDANPARDAFEHEWFIARGVLAGDLAHAAAVLELGPRVVVHLLDPLEHEAVPAAAFALAEPRDAEVDDVRALVGADDDVVLALEIAVRDTGSVHGVVGFE